MIAIISSTIYPPEVTKNTLYRGTISPKERLTQTVETINSLLKLDIKDIYLVDNSGINWKEEANIILKNVKLIRVNSYQFTNKGISEIYMLLSALPYIPDNCPILKVSGRYTLHHVLNKEDLGNEEFAGKFSNSTRNISSRAYYAINKKTLEKILTDSLNEIYAYSHKIVGPRSFIQVLKNAFCYKLYENNFYDPGISVERGMYMALRNYSILELDKLFIKGTLSGPMYTQPIDE